MIMQELDSVWSYQIHEGIDELKQKLLYTSLELEIAKTEANDEIKKSEENVRSLARLLHVAYRERDEARDQLRRLMDDRSCNVSENGDPFEELVRGKVLPEKGKLLEAVMGAGPLLSNLLVAGPLPLWRNPPPLHGLKVPPVLINGCGAVKPLDLGSCFDTSCGPSSQLMNFRTGPCLNGGRLLTSGVNMRSQIPLTKRQRFF